MNLRKTANSILRTAYKVINPTVPTGGTMDFSPGAVSIAGAYDRSAVAYSCIRRISQDISGSPILLLSDPDNPDSVIPESHPIRKLFTQPAPYLSQEQFLQYLAMWLQLRGEYFVVFDDPEAPTSMIPSLDPLVFRTIKEGGTLLGFQAMLTSSSPTYLPSDLLHHRYINPRDPFRGLTPLKAAASSLSIDISGDTLGADIVARGGETGLVYQTEDELLPEQQEELLTWLKARRNGAGQIPKDMMLAGNLTLADPKFTAFDYEIFKRMEVATQKITMVYGMSPSILGEDEAPNYATFAGRMRIYWNQTLIPIITGMESAFDGFFAVGPGDNVYVRWDRNKISGLKEDTKDQADTAKVLKDAGLPWTVIDSHLNMGLDLANIPGADEVMIPATMAPQSRLLLDWEYLPAETSVNISASQVPDRNKALTNEEIHKRVTDPLTIAQRNRQLGTLERGVSRAWRSLNFKYRKSVLAAWDKAVKDTEDTDAAYKVFVKEIEPMLVEDMAADAVDDIQPRQIRAGEMGESGIETLVTQEAAFDGINTKQGRLSPKTLAEIMKRENLIVDLTGEGLFDPIQEDVFRILTEGGEVGELRTEAQRSLDAQAEIKRNFNNSANRAVTIARTEIGTAFNVGRFNEMKAQKFKRHEWRANAGDKDTRESHNDTHGVIQDIGKTFQPIGLTFPQDPAGPAEDVINCRCLTVPVLEEE